MKVQAFGLSIFAGLAFAQDSGNSTAEEIFQAVDQCTQSAFDACPTDVSAAHRCLKVEKIADSAGIGSGKLYPNSSATCARYDQSYPAYLQSHELMPQNPPADFEFLACSGATSPEILDSQVSSMSTGYDVITVSAGGNDVGLSSILNACVFQWNPFANCADEMQATLNLIRDTLPGNLDKLYAGLSDKINPGRKVYVTGYATFFDNTTTACDNVSWAFWFNSENKQFLTTERRTLMNELTLATNAAIEAAVKRAGDSFEYVGYDQYFSVLQGRFCEAGVKEPDGNRNGLLFFQWTSETADPTLLTRREVETSELLQFDHTQMIPREIAGEPELLSLEARGSPLGLLGMFHKRAGRIWSSLQHRKADNSGTVTPILQNRQTGSNATDVPFEQYIANSISEARTKNSSLVISLPDNSAADPAFRGRNSLQVSDFIGDEIKRVFHPRPGGHAIIANLVLWRMTEDNAVALGDKPNATEAAGCAVPVPSTPSVPETIPGVLPNCQAAALACLNCLGSANGFGIFACTFRYHSDCNACGGGDGCPC
ncbi:fibronectin type iii domain protein [Colletotrichum tofieldiae]|nr:fibronectin type iii domain protein [Colletotrichum tofieldiae]